jgi:hypothetical protein
LQKLNCFDGSLEQSKTALTAYIRESALFQRHQSYRWVQRIFNSLWRNYDGLVKAKEANAAAAIGAANSALRADERKTKDAARKAASRSIDPAMKARTLDSKIAKLRNQAVKLRADAAKKEIRALAVLAASKELHTEAERKDEKADQLSTTLQESRLSRTRYETLRLNLTSSVGDLDEPVSELATMRR